MTKQHKNKQSIVDYLNITFEGFAKIKSAQELPTGDLDLDITFTKKFETLCRQYFKKEDLNNEDYQKYFLYLVDLVLQSETEDINKFNENKNGKTQKW
jgi:hypothetical protein